MAQATMAAASALASGQLTSHLSRPHATSDSRLLLNLIKSERSYISNLHSSVSSAHAASSALSAWGTSEAPDVTDTSARLSSLLSACADVQNTHVQAIEGYRAALKDVADREASIRNVVRDRDILVGRLIKASNRSVNQSGKSKKSPEERAEKVALAQRELRACEGVLAQEEAALVGVKRRTFKEALTMRMKTMGDAGAAMVEAAQEAILLLDAFDSNAHQMPHSPIYNEQMSNSTSQEWDAYQHQQADEQHYDEAAHDERIGGHSHHFENSSVTPSQSASQIYQPKYQSRDSTAYSAPFHGIGEDEGEAQRHSQEQRKEESDSDEEDWKRIYGQGKQDNVHHRGSGSLLPAPHQLSANVGTHQTFMPYAVANESTPAPTPPAKDQDRQLSSASLSRSSTKKKQQKSKMQERSDQFGPPNTVAMPPVPTAPRFNPDGINIGPIPMAPKLYMPGASGDQDDSSSDDERPVASHQDRWAARPQADDASSDGGRTAKQVSRPAAIKRNSSFFGKVGRLFKTDVKGDTDSKSKKETRSRKDSLGSSTWNTRTDSLVKETQKYAGKGTPSSLSRKQGALHRQVAQEQQDSSDEEPIDERNLIRVTNPKRPMWQGPKSGSDIGSTTKLTDELKRPSAIKRTSSASVTAGPASWKAKQEEDALAARRRAEGNLSPTQGLSRSSTLTPSTTKKKKKSSTTETARRAGSLDGGSEIGTQSTRSKPSADVSKSTTQRHSVIVPGDASAGIRRSDSLDYGSISKPKKKSSKRRSVASTSNLPQSGAGAMTPVDGQGKFTTSNWVAKASNVKDDAAVPVPAVAKSSAIPTANGNSQAASGTHLATPKAGAATPSTPSKLKQSHTANEEMGAAPKHVPQPSAIASPPLKPALKMPGSTELTRSGSVTSSMAGMPTLPPPVSAPAPVSSMRLPDDAEFAKNRETAYQALEGNTQEQGTPASVLSIEEDKRFDGSGTLGVTDYDQGRAEQAARRKTNVMALPRIDMPKSEPFQVDLDSKRTGDKTNTPVRESTPGDVLTPGERSAYQSYLAQQEESPSKTQNNQPSGVTRFTDRIASVGRGVLGMRGNPPQKLSVDTDPPQQGAPGKLSRTYSDQNMPLSSDSSEDEAAIANTPAQNAVKTAKADKPAAAAAPALAPPPSNAAVATLAPASLGENAVGASSTDGGSGVGRRKSVRMAPDVKLPPETPTDLGGSKETSYDFSNRGSALSSRIAPPPPAPPRVTVQADRPLDIGAHPREIQAWSIRPSQMDDSSDEDDINEYNQARKAFGTVSKTWGKTAKSPTTKSKASAPAETASLGGGSIKKKKKRVSTNHGYNPDVPLPSGIEVVGRSESFRRSAR